MKAWEDGSEKNTKLLEPVTVQSMTSPFSAVSTYLLLIFTLYLVILKEGVSHYRFYSFPADIASFLCSSVSFLPQHTVHNVMGQESLPVLRVDLDIDL